MTDNAKKQSWPFQIPQPDTAAVKKFNLFRLEHDLEKGQLFLLLVDMLPNLSDEYIQAWKAAKLKALSEQDNPHDEPKEDAHA